jgi:hypothetical protein
MLVVEPAETVSTTVVLGLRNVRHAGWYRRGLSPLIFYFWTNQLWGYPTAAEGCETGHYRTQPLPPTLRRRSAVEAAPSATPTWRGCFHGETSAQPDSGWWRKERTG